MRDLPDLPVLACHRQHTQLQGRHTHNYPLSLSYKLGALTLLGAGGTENRSAIVCCLVQSSYCYSPAHMPLCLPPPAPCRCGLLRASASCTPMAAQVRAALLGGPGGEGGGEGRPLGAWWGLAPFLKAGARREGAVTGSHTAQTRSGGSGNGSGRERRTKVPASLQAQVRACALYTAPLSARTAAHLPAPLLPHCRQELRRPLQP